MKKLLAVLIAAGVGIALYPSAKPASAGGSAPVLLKDLPEFAIKPDNYRADPYLAAASKIQSAGKDRARQLLAELAKDPEHGEKVIVLCRMLFTTRAGAEFRRPLIGAAHFLGKTDYAAWPLEPIELVDGVPFLITRGYSLGGQAEPAGKYLAYCLRNCDWREAKLGPRTEAEKQKALAKLLVSPKWKAALTDGEKEFLSSQIK
jgi:hypothetical protein